MQDNQEMKPVLISVYGTLRSGCGNHQGRLDQPGVKFIGTTKTEPKFTMYGKNAGFPVVKREGQTSLTLEVYEVSSPQVMSKLNSLEGCTGITDHPSNWYNIVPIETEFGQAMIYVQDTYNGSKESIIESGDWMNRR